ncbi:uncharacterized protein N7529_010716 [Penicillium soppii]|uniref:uncharacterized protein n=1 Tax=Penicillium soppii TaxID=69789 RepID=UPI00254938F2|nr:uncharacterized protein N7529_010716 [Penicillium soppii]KAJ5851331.1 hypothetical protein N7529_010716 [Penicillium soppii]
MLYQSSLPDLNTKEAIADALYRATIGFDRNDIKVFESAMTEDTSFEINPGPNDPRSLINGLSTLKSSVFDHVGPLDTTHMITNVRVNHRAGEKTASLTAYALSQHCPPGRGAEFAGPKYIAGSEYWIDLVQGDGDGLWKIKKWVIDVIWRQGDPSVIQRPSSK